MWASHAGARDVPRELHKRLLAAAKAQHIPRRSARLAEASDPARAPYWMPQLPPLSGCSPLLLPRAAPEGTGQDVSAAP